MDGDGGVKYGLPYRGSKSRIAEWVVSVLPPAPVLVDLFAGGCAVTHAALHSGKWGRIVANYVSGVKDACGYLGVKGYERPLLEPASAPHGGKRGRNGGERSARDMHHTYAAWTEGERELLRRDYPLHGTSIPALRERHTTTAIKAQAKKLGVRRAH